LVAEMMRAELKTAGSDQERSDGSSSYLHLQPKLT